MMSPAAIVGIIVMYLITGLVFARYVYRSEPRETPKDERDMMETGIICGAVWPVMLFILVMYYISKAAGAYIKMPSHRERAIIRARDAEKRERELAREQRNQVAAAERDLDDATRAMEQATRATQRRPHHPHR